MILNWRDGRMARKPRKADVAGNRPSPSSTSEFPPDDPQAFDRVAMVCKSPMLPNAKARGSR